MPINKEKAIKNISEFIIKESLECGFIINPSEVYYKLGNFTPKMFNMAFQIALNKLEHEHGFVMQ
jgi:hypothetical protein